MSVVYAISEADGMGKSAFVASLASFMKDHGHMVSVSKPVVSSPEDQDSLIFADLLNLEVGMSPVATLIDAVGEVDRLTTEG